jgi:hypothetical protein
MNIERFNTILFDIVKDNERLDLTTLLQSFQKTFAQNISQPNPNSADMFVRSRKELWDALGQCASNAFPPSQKAFVDSIEVTHYIGNGLRTALEQIMTDNAATPGQAVPAIQAHIQKTIEFWTQAKTINTALEEMVIGYDYTNKGEYEVGVVFPVELFDNKLEGLQKELCKLNRYLEAFSEIATEDTTSPSIRTITTDSLAVFLAAAGTTAWMIAKAVEKCVVIYAHVLQIRKLRQDMKKTEVPDKLLNPIGTYEKELVAQDLERLSKELFKEYKKKSINKEREPELQSLLTKALQYIMKRLDQGVDFEVTPPAVFDEIKEDTSEKDKNEIEKQKEDAKKLSERSAKIKELPKREKPLLFLPEPDDDEAPKEPADIIPD